MKTKKINNNIEDTKVYDTYEYLKVDDEEEFSYFSDVDTNNVDIDDWETIEVLKKEQENFDDVFSGTSYVDYKLTFSDISYKYKKNYTYKEIEKLNNVKKYYLSQNQHLDLITQIKLIASKDMKIFFNLLNNPCFDVEVLKNLPYEKIKKLDFFSKQKIVKSDKIHTTMIEKILNDEKCLFLYKTASENKSFSKEKRRFFGRETQKLLKTKKTIREN